MGIEIPGSLQWVSYLAGSKWPQGDETAMFRIGDYWAQAANDLSELIPEFERVHSQTLQVFEGESARAFDEVFRQLFSGDASADELAEAMAALGEAAENTGRDIEHTKLIIITTLAIAAAQIVYALAMAVYTAGASLGWAALVEGGAMAAIRRIVAQLIENIAAKLAASAGRTAVQQLVWDGLKGLGLGLGQELLVQQWQINEDHRDGFDGRQLGQGAAAGAAGGAAGSAAGRGLGNVPGLKNPVTRGAVTGAGSGVANNVASGAASVPFGGELSEAFSAPSLIGGAAMGGVPGAVHGFAEGKHGGVPGAHESASNPTRSTGDTGGVSAGSEAPSAASPDRPLNLGSSDHGSTAAATAPTTAEHTGAAASGADTAAAAHPSTTTDALGGPAHDSATPTGHTGSTHPGEAGSSPTPGSHAASGAGASSESSAATAPPGQSPSSGEGPPSGSAATGPAPGAGAGHTAAADPGAASPAQQAPAGTTAGAGSGPSGAAGSSGSAASAPAAPASGHAGLSEQGAPAGRSGPSSASTAQPAGVPAARVSDTAAGHAPPAREASEAGRGPSGSEASSRSAPEAERAGSPAREGHPPREGPLPPREGKPAPRESPPTPRESQPASPEGQSTEATHPGPRDGQPFPHPEQPAPHDGTPFKHEGPAPDHDGPSPAPEGASADHDGPSPGPEGASADHDGPSPLEPTHPTTPRDQHPAPEAEPAREGTRPAHLEHPDQPRPESESAPRPEQTRAERDGQPGGEHDEQWSPGPDRGEHPEPGSPGEPTPPPTTVAPVLPGAGAEVTTHTRAVPASERVGATETPRGADRRAPSAEPGREDPAARLSEGDTASGDQRGTGPEPQGDFGGLSAEKRAEIIAMEKGTRPDPSEYLSPEYIEQHLEQFEDGATRFVPETNLDKYGIAQRDGTSFVMPKHEADAMLEATRGDPRLLERELGLPEGFLDSTKLVRVDVPRPHEPNLRMPSGNEAGANEHWIPGGKLPNGASEAVIDAGALTPDRYAVTELGAGEETVRGIGDIAAGDEPLRRDSVVVDSDGSAETRQRAAHDDGLIDEAGRVPVEELESGERVRGWPCDDSGYRIREDDLRFLGLDDDQVQAWQRFEAPLGMTGEQFAQFTGSLKDALAADGIDASQVDVRLQGSSAQFFSGSHKDFPTAADLAGQPEAQARLAEWMGDRPEADRPARIPFDAKHLLGMTDGKGVPEPPSDYDVQFASDAMVDKARQTWEAMDPEERESDLMHPKYDFVDKDVAKVAFRALHAWKRHWEELLGREVAPAVFGSAGPPDKTGVGSGISTHFRDSDWIINHPGGPRR